MNKETKSEQFITLSKGGTGKRLVKISEIKIPDVWNYGKTDYEKSVVECWHLTHDLLRELKERSKG